MSLYQTLSLALQFGIAWAAWLIYLNLPGRGGN